MSMGQPLTEQAEVAPSGQVGCAYFFVQQQINVAAKLVLCSHAQLEYRATVSRDDSSKADCI